MNEEEDLFALRVFIRRLISIIEENNKNKEILE